MSYTQLFESVDQRITWYPIHPDVPLLIMNNQKCLVSIFADEERTKGVPMRIHCIYQDGIGFTRIRNGKVVPMSVIKAYSVNALDDFDIGEMMPRA